MYVPHEGKPPFDPRQPFSRAEARAAGLTPETLLTKRFHKLFWDSYVLHTGAELWGATVPDDGNTHVTLPSALRRQVRRGVKSHCAQEPAKATLRRGLPISTPEQTFLELAAAGLRLVDLVVVADGMIKAKHTTEERLREAAAGWHGGGCRVARRAAGLARDGVDSPMETRLRVPIILAGLTEPR